MSTPLETAKQKLTVIEFDYDNLPTEDNATLWVDIRNEAKLSLNEFAALKKERCLGKPPPPSALFLFISPL